MKGQANERTWLWLIIISADKLMSIYTIRKFLLVVSCILIALPPSCSGINKAIPGSQFVNSDNDNNEPLYVKENSVVFLSLSESQYDSLSEDVRYEYIELISDFMAYIDKVEKTLREHDLNIYSSESKELVFLSSDKKETRLLFNADEYPVAIAVFGRGKKPKIYYHIVLDKDMLEVFKEYFGIDFSKH